MHNIIMSGRNSVWMSSTLHLAHLQDLGRSQLHTPDLCFVGPGLTRIALHPQGTAVLSGGEDGSVYLTALASAKITSSLSGQKMGTAASSGLSLIAC